MTNNRQNAPPLSLTVLCGRIVILFFALGGAGAIWGGQLMQFMQLMSERPDAGGVTAGEAYLLASAVLAVPGALILRHAGGSSRR